MPSFFERIGLTGGKKAPAEGQPDQLQNPGLPKKEWERILAVASNDPAKMQDLMKSLADYNTAKEWMSEAGGAKNFGKQAEEAAAQRAEEISRQKTVELSELELQRKAQYAKILSQQEQLESERKTAEILGNIESAFAADAARKKDEEERLRRRGLEGLN